MTIATIIQMTLILMGLPLAGQAPTYPVHGSLTLETPIEDRPLIYLEPLSARPIEQTFVEPSGDFTFSNVPAGTYYVRVKQEGFEEFAQRIEVPAYGRDITIFLRRKSIVPVKETDARIGSRFQVNVRQLSIPEKAVREYLKGLEDNQKGKTPTAIKRFQRALKLAPDFIEAAFHLGSTLYRLGHFEDAEAILQRALKVSPEEPHLRLMLANVLVKEGKYSQALSEIDTYLKANQDSDERSSAETTREQLIRVLAK